MEMTATSYNMVRLAKRTSVAVQVIAHNLPAGLGASVWASRQQPHDPSATRLLPHPVGQGSLAYLPRFSSHALPAYTHPLDEFRLSHQSPASPPFSVDWDLTRT